jgi:hypothetical protein
MFGPRLRPPCTLVAHLWQGFVRFLQQRYLGAEVPVVQNMSKHSDISCRQRVPEEVATQEVHPIANARLAYIIVEDRSNLG